MGVVNRNKHLCYYKILGDSNIFCKLEKKQNSYLGISWNGGIIVVTGERYFICFGRVVCGLSYNCFFISSEGRNRIQRVKRWVSLLYVISSFARNDKIVGNWNLVPKLRDKNWDLIYLFRILCFFQILSFASNFYFRAVLSSCHG